MDRVDIAGRADDEVQALSSGNQQRVQLAIALVHDPELLILDEPFSGLDPVAVENMKQILDDQLRAGTSVLFSSHQLDLVTDISREVVIVDGGSVVLSGDVRTIRERADFRYATIRFSSTTEWTPTVGVLVAPGGATTERIDDAVRVEVRADVSPAAVLADAERAGTVVEFAFAPPDLSEVFFTAVGRRPHEEGRRPHEEGRRPHDEGRRPHEESVVER
jgi:ABC-2 type transport system ATP-binding protein